LTVDDVKKSPDFTAKISSENNTPVVPSRSAAGRVTAGHQDINRFSTTGWRWPVNYR